VLTTAPTCSASATASAPAGSYAITCSGGVAANYAFRSQPGTLTVTQEDAAVQLTSPQTVAALPSSGSATLPLVATVWDSAANGYSGANPESGPTATLGDITQMYVEFDLYLSGSCLSGAPSYMPIVRVQDTGTIGDGVGTASYTFSQATEGSFCVVPRVVAADGTANPYYTAPDGQVTGLAFYTNSGQFATGGGWIADALSSTGKGSLGFNARYTKTGGAKGQMVYVWRGSYNGQAADFIIKSNALTSLTFAGSGSAYTATLQGKASYTIVAVATGQQLYGEGNDTFTATVTDGDNGASQQNAAADSFALTTFQSNNTKLHPISPTALGGGNIVAHN
jgi:hypothetical protein